MKKSNELLGEALEAIACLKGYLVRDGAQFLGTQFICSELEFLDATLKEVAERIEKIENLENNNETVAERGKAWPE